MSLGPPSKSSNLARDVSALLLVGASFMPRETQAAEVNAATITPELTAVQTIDSEPEQAVQLKEFRLPQRQPSSLSLHVANQSHNFTQPVSKNNSALPGFLDAIADQVEIFDEAFRSLKVGFTFDPLGQGSDLNGRVSLSGNGGVTLSLEARDADRLPRLDLSGEPFYQGGSVRLRLKLL